LILVLWSIFAVNKLHWPLERVLIVIVMLFCIAQLHAGDELANWTYGENVLNETVSGNAFKPRPGLPLECVDGPGGKAAFFREGQYLSGKLPVTLTPPFTLEIMCLPTGNARGAVNGLFQQMNHSRDGFRVGIQRNGQALFLYQGAGKEHYVRSNAILSTGQWHHIAYAVHQDAVDLYIDGKLDITGKFECPFTPSSADTMIGQYSGTGGTFNGLIGKVIIKKGLGTEFASQIQQVKLANESANLAAVLPKQMVIEPQDISPEDLKKSLVFAVGFNGDVSAQTSAGMTDALDANVFDLKQGKLVDGIVGQAIDIKAGQCLRYPTPDKMPPAEGGTISIWFKFGDWFSDKAAEHYKKADYARRKTLFSADGVKGAPWGPWSGQVLIVGNPADKVVELSMQLGSPLGLSTQTPIDPDTWHNLIATWGHDAADPRLVRGILYLDGNTVDEALSNNIPTNALGDHINISSTNPGVTFSGLLDEMMMLDQPLTPGQVLGYYQSTTSPK
jgi:hypothetical protein